MAKQNIFEVIKKWGVNSLTIQECEKAFSAANKRVEGFELEPNPDTPSPDPHVREMRQLQKEVQEHRDALLTGNLMALDIVEGQKEKYQKILAAQAARREEQ